MTNENSEFIIKTICKTLVDSAEHLSGMKPHRETVNRCKKKRPWTPEINLAMKRSKSCFAKWKAEGKPRDSHNRHFKSMKLSKERLRSLQRLFEADKRREKFEHIMSLHQSN